MNQLRQLLLDVIHKLQTLPDSINNAEAVKFKAADFKLTKNGQPEENEIKVKYKKINKV